MLHWLLKLQWQYSNEYQITNRTNNIHNVGSRGTAEGVKVAEESIEHLFTTSQKNKMKIDKLPKYRRRLAIIGITIPLVIYICIVVWIVSLVEFSKTFSETTTQSFEAVFDFWRVLWNDPKPLEKENFEDLWDQQ